MKRLYLDIHVLQTVPPSCINRDDMGTPKSAVYGGVTRARVSSQSWKRAMRQMFVDAYGEENLGVRTKNIASVIAKELETLGFKQEDAIAASVDAMIRLGMIAAPSDNSNKKDDKEDKKKTSKKKQDDSKEEKINMETKALTFIGYDCAKRLAKIISESEIPDRKDDSDEGEKANRAYKRVLQKAMSGPYPVNIALFGRMVADDPGLSCDAAAQVAHSISTHEVHVESDYFTAVDDLKVDSSGAGHLGVAEFCSATLYRYATVAVHELARNCKDDVAIAAREFVKAFVLSMPTGKQNTFANRTVPGFVYVTIRADQPVNLVNAFEKPVLPGKDGFMDRSIEALKETSSRIYKDFLGEPEASVYVGKEVEGMGKRLPMKDVLTFVKEYVRNSANDNV